MAAYASGSLVSQLWNDCRHRGCGWNWAALCSPVSAVRSDGCAGGRCSPCPRGRRLKGCDGRGSQSSSLSVQAGGETPAPNPAPKGVFLLTLAVCLKVYPDTDRT